MKRYFEPQTSAPIDAANDLIQKYHLEDMNTVRLGILFVEDPEHTDMPCLEHQGYPAAGMARVISARDRAAGLPDVQIILDKAVWDSKTENERRALLDHELQHFERVLDADGRPKVDANGRPRIRIRRHDHQYGWFDVIASRWREDSNEVQQAKRLIDSVGQLYFDFEEAA